MESIIGFLKGIVATISLLVASVFGQIDPNTVVVGPILAIDPIVEISTTTEQVPVATTTTTTTKTKEEIAYELGKMVGVLEQQVTELEKKVAEATTTQPTPAPTSPQPEPTVQPLPEQPKPSMSEIKIISPIPVKGLGRSYTAQPQVVDESNYIDIGILVKNDDGSVNKDATVTITATDESQNKTLKGTGNLYTYYVDGNKRQDYYYPFHYEFRSVGDHTITFSANGMTESVTLTVTAPDPA